MHSHLVLLSLVLTILLVSAKNLRQIDGDNDVSDEQSEVFHSIHKLNQSPILQDMLVKFLKNQETHQHENDKYDILAKRAKAIIKGDPREFMG